MILFIIFSCLFIISLILVFLCLIEDWYDSALDTFTIVLIISSLGMIVSAAFINPGIKSIKYPVSEYDFKIKVIEVEEQRDTILVVIPKEK